jgi:hypothetical protein
MRPSSSRIVVGLMFALALTLAAGIGVYAQQAAAQEAPAQQQAPPALTYPGDAVVVLNYIQNAKTTDFENVMQRVKEALQKSDKPERRQQADGWKVFKSPDPSGIEGVTVYVFVIDPVVKGANYNLGVILQEGFPDKYGEIYKSYADSYNTGPRKLVPINLNSVLSFK